MTNPRLAVIGLGRMGRLVRQLAEERGWMVPVSLGSGDNAGGRGITAERLRGVDVAIEFSSPDSAPGNAIACARVGCPVVVGTTGWLDRMEPVARAVRESDGAMFWAPNFSLGVNVFWRACEHAARLLAGAEGIAPHILETHHAAKLDAPSGTALELQRRVASALGDTEVPVTSVRVGSVPGTHELVFDGTFEQLRIEHVARDRRVFAEGALRAAEWLAGRWRQGARGVFGMDDLLDDLLSSPSTGRPGS